MGNKKVFSILLVVCMLLGFMGCQSEDFKLYYELQSDITTADPQLAQSDSELLLIKNIFEGLFRLDSNGKPVAGAADCTISKDGAQYNFTIHKEAQWYNGTPLTADDFAFGLERTLTRATESPYAQSLFPIKNAESFYNGQIDFSAVGIHTDGKDKLTITLSAPYNDFPYILASACAMPCNRKFFESTKGQYGLNKKAVLSNGSFYLKTWDEENGIVLGKSNDYKGDFYAKAYAVYLPLAEDNNTAGRLMEKSIDGGRVLYSDENRLSAAEFTTKKFPVCTYSLIFNSSVSKDLRSILIEAVDFKKIKSELSPYMTATDTLIPMTLENNGGTITYPVYNSTQAREQFLQYVKKQGSPTLTVLCIKDDNFSFLLKNIISCWQNTLGAYGINIEYVETENELLQRLQADNYTIALAPFQDNGGSVYDFLFPFSAVSPQNYLNREHSEFDTHLSAYADNGSAASLQQAIKSLSSEHLIVPICSVNKIYAISSSFKNAVFFNFGGEIDFSMLKK